MVRALALFCLTLAGCSGAIQGQDQSPKRLRCTVASVTDGDTFRCEDGTRVRLLQIDSPEQGQGEMYQRARTGLMRYLKRGRKVQLELDVRPTDQYDRTLAYVWAGKTLVNEAMVRDGWAVQFTLPPNVRYVDRIRAAEYEAREAKRGLWSDGDLACRPADFRRRKCP